MEQADISDYLTAPYSGHRCRHQDCPVCTRLKEAVVLKVMVTYIATNTTVIKSAALIEEWMSELNIAHN